MRGALVSKMSSYKFSSEHLKENPKVYRNVNVHHNKIEVYRHVNNESATIPIKNIVSVSSYGLGKNGFCVRLQLINGEEIIMGFMDEDVARNLKQEIENLII